MSKHQNKAIGIDLGTTNSCAGVWQNGRVEIVPNEFGKRTTPSVVSFDQTERLIGEDAVRQMNRNPRNTIYEIKRFIGRSFSDKQVQTDLKNYSYAILDPTQEDRPQIYVEYRNEDRLFYPEEISAFILEKMKDVSSMHLGEEVYQAVITVPAYFNDSQRQATKDAGKIAGLNVLRVLNEPTAAAIAYGLDRKYESSKKDTNILVFDLGGGTFDVSLLTLGCDGIFEVRAISGDTHLGGADFDQALMKHIILSFESKYRTKIPHDNYKAWQKIRQAAEKAKCALSTTLKTYIEIDALVDGIDFSMQITRSEFENLVDDLVQRCLIPVKQVLYDSRIEASNVEDVVLVGGSTRIPKIQQVLSEFFGGKELCKSINPDEAVAYGAAIQAGILSQTAENPDESLPDYVLLDVAPLSLGLETAGGLMTTLIKRNCTIPVTKSKVFSTAEDDQDTVTVQVYEGERTETKHNRLLGSFDLEGIELAPRGVPQIEVTFEVDADGIFTVTANDISKGVGKGNERKLHIVNNKGRLNEEQIEEMVRNAEKYKESDALFRKLMEVRNDYLNILYGIRSLVQTDERFKQFANEEEKKLLMDTFHAELEWVKKQENFESAKSNNSATSVEPTESATSARSAGPDIYLEKMEFVQRDLVRGILEAVNERRKLKANE
jgi:L1 cell adhesion molecule like protein